VTTTSASRSTLILSALADAPDARMRSARQGADIGD
jgi:hypothetical protein